MCKNMSHNNFNAFFSSGDDKDEVAGKLFGVIGMCHTDNPTSVWRVGFNRQTKSLKLEDIFDVNTLKINTNSDYIINYEKAISNITEKVSNVFKTSSTSTAVSKSVTEEYLDHWVTDSLDDSFYSDVSKKTLRSPYTSVNLTDTLIKNTIFDSKEGLDELKFFLYDFNTLFQKKATVKDQDIYNIYTSLSTLVFENFNCDSELYNNIVQEITNVYEANI